MAERQQLAGSEIKSSVWLAGLIDTFERTEQLRNVPCDARLLTAAQSRLEQAAGLTQPNLSALEIQQ